MENNEKTFGQKFTKLYYNKEKAKPSLLAISIQSRLSEIVDDLNNYRNSTDIDKFEIRRTNTCIEYFNRAFDRCSELENWIELKE